MEIKKKVSKDRIVFAEIISYDEHLERIRFADLFLDTFNYNAHTTCSDALWSGLPVVTKIGEQFASRVAASLLNALGMNELVTQNSKEYETLILKFAKNKSDLIKLREKLNKNIKTKPLFNTKEYVSDFEKLMENAYEKNNK